MRRINESLETYKYLNESNNRLAEKEIKAINEREAANENFRNRYYAAIDMRNRKAATRAQLMEAARNDNFSTVLKAIYITALEAETLTDEGLILAENMVDNWIRENGGASKILGKSGNKTYLLSRITQIVEDAATADVEEIESGEPEDNEDEKSDGNSKKDEALNATREFLKTAKKKDVKDFLAQVFKSSLEDDEEKAAEKKEKKDDNVAQSVKDMIPDKKEDESEEAAPETSFDDEEDIKLPESEENEKKDDNVAQAVKDMIPDKKKDDEEIEDDTDDELGEPLDDDGIDQDTTIDGGSENKGQIFDDLSKEEDIQKAVEIIRNRIADAEETFIKNNAEDKKKIDELLDKISNNVKTVEDINNKADKKSQIAEESVRMYKRHIDSIKEHSNLTIFEQVARNLSRNIVKDEAVRESYITESGSLDTDLIVESAKVMYGFLETINTLQLEKVDAKYIKNILETM